MRRHPIQSPSYRSIALTSPIRREPHHVAKFVNDRLSRSVVPHDVDAAFRKWMLDEQERAGQRRRRRSGNAFLDALMDDIKGDQP